MLLESVLRDLRYSLRLIRRNPAWSWVAIGTLALGVGTCTAMFSVVHGILVRPLPYLEPDRLVHVRAERDYAESGRPAPASFTAEELDDLGARLPSLESFAFYSAESHTLSRDGGTEVLPGATVSDGFFPTLRGNIVIGRPLGPADDASPAVVISERLWSRAFGRSPGAVGERLTLNSGSYAVVGVAANDFAFPSPLTDVWTPARLPAHRDADVLQLPAPRPLEACGVADPGARRGRRRRRGARRDSRFGLLEHPRHYRRSARTGGGVRPAGARAPVRGGRAGAGRGLCQRRPPPVGVVHGALSRA